MILGFIFWRVGSLLLLVVSRVFCGSFSNNPGTVSVHENEDNEVTLWSISATCTVDYTCSTSCSTNCNCWFNFLGIQIGCSTCYKTCYKTCTTTVGCNRCDFSSNPSSSLFSMSPTSGMTVKKNACSSPGCGPTCSQSGCSNGPATYSIGVQCWRTGYNTNGLHTNTFTVQITQNAAPTFTFSSGASIDVSHDSASSGTVVNTMIATDSDSSIDGDSVYYRLSSGPNPSFIHGNTLFALNTAGQIYVTQDLSMEFSYTFSMTLCVGDRRQDESCNALSITLHACFQTPNCTSQSDYTILDTHGGYTGHGTTNTLFQMSYPNPDEHFTAFSSSWHQLYWTFDSNELTSSTINYNTGEIYLTTNISIHPAYPSKDFTQVVRVGNTESCYTTTCTMNIRVWYTNWPIEIRSLDATTYIHEDTDAETMIHSLVLFDYNYEYEDNFTCTLNSISPNENNLFELRHVDGLHNYNSYRFYKLVCQQAGCGYKYGTHSGIPWLCHQNIGCLNNELRDTYVLSITCSDAYGSSDTGTLTVRIIDNSVPVWRNLPSTITLDTDSLSALDTVFSILYTDGEGETLIYEYTYGPTDYGYFLGTSTGNYYNDLANITMTIHLWEKANESLWIYINAHERRNMIDEHLYINIRDYCGETPTCNDHTSSQTEEFSIGSEVVSIASLLNAPSNGVAFTGVTYHISSNPSGYFTVDSSTGSITTTQVLDASDPASNYSIRASVFVDNACGYAVCHILLTVTHVNYAISITNLPSTVSIHEDTTTITTMFQVTTSDNNQDDTPTCVITTVSPAQAAGSAELFYIDETIPGSNVYVIKNRENPGLTSATTVYTISIQCSDGHGSSDSGDLTINIDLNQSPTFANLASPTSVTIDPALYTSGDRVYTVSGTDTENDVLTYSCTVSSTFVPFECEQGTNVVYVKLRRTVSIVTENNSVYSVTITISDPKHTDAQTGTLTATFTSSRTHPSISNLDATVTIDEDVAIGTSVFDLDVTDPDVGDVHTFILTASSPGTGHEKFSLNTATGVVTTKASLDYETTTSYVLKFNVQDENLAALNIKDLTVSVNNINEAPSLTASTILLSFAEDLAVGGQIGDPGFNCSDPDAGDTHTYTITSGTHAAYFSTNSNNGVISLAQTWDLENGLPQTTNFVVTCTDSGGLTATIGITTETTYANEFTPQATVTIPGGATTITISAATSVIEDLLTVAATDSDAGPSPTFTFDLIGNGAGKNYFTVVTSGSIATLRVKNTINLYYDTFFNFTIKVSDGELFTGAGVHILYNNSDTSTVSGKEDKCTTCTTNGRALVAVLGIEAAIILCITGHVVWHVYRVRASKKLTSNPLNFNEKDKSGRTRWSRPSGVVPGVTMKGPPFPNNKTNVPTRKPNTVSPVSITQLSVNDVNDEEDDDSIDESDSDDSVDSLQHRRRMDIARTTFPGAYTSKTGLPGPVYTRHLQGPGSYASTGLPPPIYGKSVTASRGPR